MVVTIDLLLIIDGASRWDAGGWCGQFLAFPAMMPFLATTKNIVIYNYHIILHNFINYYI